MSIIPNLDTMTDEEKLAALESIQQSIRESKELQKQKVAKNVDLVVQALKKIESDIRTRFEGVGTQLEKRISNIKDGRDGIDGRDGKDGEPGRPGKDGKDGRPGRDGKDGVNGVDGQDGISVVNVFLDFDNSLVIELSDGRQINAGEILPPDIADRLKVVINQGASGGGGGASLPDQTGNLGKFLTTDGTNASWGTPAGSGDVVGPASATDNAIARFDSTTGKLIQNSVVTVSDTGAVAGVTSLGVASYVDFNTSPTVTNAAGRLYWDSTQKTLSVGLTTDIAADIGQTLYAYVTNAEASTINKGQPVYMFAASGDRVSVKLASNSADATSAKTLGVCAEDIAAGAAGMVLCQGVQDGLNLSAYSPGDTLYLGSTAGTLTSTKPYAPNHLVYIGVVERANAGNGRLYVRVQNGYELDELHNVSAQSPTGGQTLVYNSSNSLWESSDTFTSPKIISANSSSDALRITQTGAGNALVVEDSANPDSTPFVVDASGRVVVGHTSALAATVGIPNIQYVGGAVPFGHFGFASTAAIGAFTFARSKSATIGTNAALVTGDQIGVFRFQGADGGSAYLDGAQIIAAADGSFSATSSPGRLVFSTTADGASSVTERMRIDSAGQVAIGSSTSTAQSFRVAKAITGSTTAYSIVNQAAVQSGVTSSATMFYSGAATQAASFTLSSLNHYSADQNTFGASSTVTNQYGFVANSSLTGATNNYGFYSNIASGTGRWNFYANGTADNRFNGNVGIGITPAVALDVVGVIEAQAAATQDAIRLQGRAGGTSSYAVTLTPTTLTASRTITLPDATTTVVGTDTTQTLTNKRITPRVSTTTSSATPTINTDNVDQYGLTAQTVDITSFTTNLSGTPTDGQKLWIYIVGTAARAITWGASFEASTVALPTTTVSTNRLDVGFVWNAATSKWRCVATA